jgi:hypothetical protein
MHEKKKKRRAEESSSGEPSASNSPNKGFPVSGQKASFKLMFQPFPREVQKTSDVNGEDGFPPVELDPVVMVDAQSRFTVAVTSLGKLYTWGSVHCYQLGNEETEDEPSPYKVDLKTRKCFWARCGGQFTMFLLEPKQDDQQRNEQSEANGVQSKTSSKPPSRRNSTFQNGNKNPSSSPEHNDPSSNQQFFQALSPRQYRNQELSVAMTSSMPNSPALRSRQKLATLPEHNSSPEKKMEDEFLGRTSPTMMLAANMENIVVSPEKKRYGGLAGASGTKYTKEQKMAPWSPKKTTALQEAPVSRPKAMRKLFPSKARQTNQIVDAAMNPAAEQEAEAPRRTRQRTQ